jgi:hypothetical protein
MEKNMENRTQQVSKKVEKINYRHEFEKDSQKVKGKFIFHEVPGGAISFTYRKYREEQPKNYTFKDGDIYEIPLGVAKHLNKNCWYPQYEFMKGETAQDIQRVGQKVRRMSFQSLEFVDIEDFSNQVHPLTRVELTGV